MKGILKVKTGLESSRPLRGSPFEKSSITTDFEDEKVSWHSDSDGTAQKPTKRIRKQKQRRFQQKRGNKRAVGKSRREDDKLGPISFVFLFKNNTFHGRQSSQELLQQLKGILIK